MEMKRININFPVELLKQIDDYADMMSLNRTSAIIVLINTALKQNQSLDVLGQIMQMLQQQEKQIKDSSTDCKAV